MTFLPCSVMHRLPDKALEARTMEALRAFGAPAGLVLEELDSEGMLDAAVEEMELLAARFNEEVRAYKAQGE